MTVTPASFRTDFPEFTDTGVYPDSAISFWLLIAENSLPADRWSNMLDLGTELFVAHNLVLEARAAKEAATGALPGGMTGPVASKTVDKLSMTYDVGAAVMDGGGDFNLTTYGVRFYRLVLMFGSGGVQF